MILKCPYKTHQPSMTIVGTLALAICTALTYKMLPYILTYETPSTASMSTNNRYFKQVSNREGKHDLGRFYDLANITELLSGNFLPPNLKHKVLCTIPPMTLEC